MEHGLRGCTTAMSKVDVSAMTSQGCEAQLNSDVGFEGCEEIASSLEVAQMRRSRDWCKNLSMQVKQARARSSRTCGGSRAKVPSLRHDGIDAAQQLHVVEEGQGLDRPRSSWARWNGSCADDDT